MDDDRARDEESVETGGKEILGELEMEAPPGTGDEARKARDSAYLVDSFQDTVAMAEILAPGIRVPVFDKRSNPKKTFDCICDLRRQALGVAHVQSEMRGALEDLVPGFGEDALKRLTTDQLRTVFRAAAMFKGQMNTPGRAGRTAETPSYTGGGLGIRSRVKSPAEINAANRRYYGGDAETRH